MLRANAHTPLIRAAIACTALGLAFSALSAAAGPTAGSAAARPAAATTHTCSPPAYPSTGYFTSLQVTGTSCTAGRKLALAYFKCRTKGGNLGGVCHGPVLGFTCRELRNSIPTEIDARVTCKRKGEVVVHTYQQNPVLVLACPGRIGSEHR